MQIREGPRLNNLISITEEEALHLYICLLNEEKKILKLADAEDQPEGVAILIRTFTTNHAILEKVKPIMVPKNGATASRNIGRGATGLPPYKERY